MLGYWAIWCGKVILLMVISFLASCGDSQQDKLFGRWEAARSDSYMEFRRDGTFVAEQHSSVFPTRTYVGEYKIKNGTILITDDNGKRYKLRYEIHNNGKEIHVISNIIDGVLFR
jgi:hypothetical protein